MSENGNGVKGVVAENGALIHLGSHEIEAQGKQFEVDQRICKAFAASGLFADVKGMDEHQAIAAAYVKVAIGRSLGIAPAAAMIDIAVVQGRPSIGAAIRGERMKAAGYDWRILRLDDEGCELEIRKDGETLGKCAYTKEDAQRAGLANKDNYKKNPKNMYFARAITNAQRFFAPECLGGISSPTPEEAEMEYPAQRHEPERGVISVEALSVSSDPNRGHGKTAPTSSEPGGPPASEASPSASLSSRPAETTTSQESPTATQTPEERSGPVGGDGGPETAPRNLFTSGLSLRSFQPGDELDDVRSWITTQVGPSEAEHERFLRNWEGTKEDILERAATHAEARGVTK